MAAEADRAIDEGAAALRLQQRSHFVDENRNVSSVLPHSHVDPEVRKRLRVVVGERLRGELRDETLVVPDLEVTLLAKHVDLARDLRAVTKPRVDHHAALRIELGDLAVKIHAIEKALPRGIRGGDLREPFFELDPHRHRIDAYGLARQARHEHI